MKMSKWRNIREKFAKLIQSEQPDLDKEVLKKAVDCMGTWEIEEMMGLTRIERLIYFKEYMSRPTLTYDTADNIMKELYSPKF